MAETKFAIWLKKWRLTNKQASILFECDYDYISKIKRGLKPISKPIREKMEKFEAEEIKKLTICPPKSF